MPASASRRSTKSMILICSWMTANLLTLNSSRTEFLLIGLPQQMAKINTSSLITTHSARNLRSIFDEHYEHFTFSDQISALSKSCCYHVIIMSYYQGFRTCLHYVDNKGTRGHTLKLSKMRCTRDCRKYFF